jgi:hypothetical protein
MKYWAYLLAKALAAGTLVSAMWHGLNLLLSPTTSFFFQSHPEKLVVSSFTHDLGYTTIMMVFFLFCSGLAYLVVWDQRYRCRTCLRRLRMPVRVGSWPNMLLIGQPRTEYICLYGHGTLKVPEVQIMGSNRDWAPHEENIWKELEALETTKR